MTLSAEFSAASVSSKLSHPNTTSYTIIKHFGVLCGSCQQVYHYSEYTSVGESDVNPDSRKKAEGDPSALSLEEVQNRLDEISKRLARVEQLIEKIGPGLDEVSESAKVIREGFEFYDGMVKLMTKFTKAERLESQYGDLKKDQISWLIIRILDNSRPLNISQLTAAIRAERGTASRRIVRERVNTLLRRGILVVMEDEDERARSFALKK